MNTWPLVSVIVPTRNSMNHMEECLQSIREQSYSNIEIIVVDNYSNDRTIEIAERYADFVYHKGPERCAQVNYGVEKATGKYIYFTGSDLRSDPDLIEQAVRKCEEEGYDAVYLNVLTDIESKNIWQRVRALERRCYYKEPGMSAARFYRKEVFQELGGMDEDIPSISDDLAFQNRLDMGNYRTAFIDAAERNLSEYDSLRIIITRSLYYGWFIKSYKERYPERAKKQYRLVRDEFTRHLDILLEDRALFAAFLFYKAVQYVCGGAGMLLGRLSGDNPKIERFLFSLNYGTDRK